MTDATIVSNMTLRPAMADDVPRFVELIAAEELPPLFIAEFLGGFVAVERSGVVVACGGLEMYGDCGVIRSVVVEPGSRGLKLGAAIAERLEADAVVTGATDIYLFTADALEFWRHRGYIEVSFNDWKRPPRLCWQYQFVTQNLELVGEVHPMWRRA